MRVLIGYDGSPSADAAIEGLETAGLPAEADAVVLAVANAWPPSEAGMLAYAEYSWAEGARVVSERVLAEAKAAAEIGAAQVRQRFPGWTVRAETVADSPRDGIVHRATHWPADLVVVGAGGGPAASHLAIMSVSHGVVLHAPCSVRVARPRPEAMAGQPVRLLLGLDGSQGSLAAVHVVAARRWPPNVEAMVLTALDDRLIAQYEEFDLASGVVPGTGNDLDRRQWIEQIRRRAADELRAAGLCVNTTLTADEAKAALLEEAATWGADCIFVGARGLRGLQRLLLGSVSGAVADRAHCSVEVVRGHPADKLARAVSSERAAGTASTGPDHAQFPA